MGRAPCCTKVGLHRGPWTAREDALLANYIHLHGQGNWRSMPKKAGLLRCGKSCRLRWMNYLRPDIKRGNITPDEDDLIIKMHSLLGNRWSLIAGRLPGRTDNEIKNYWNTHLSKKLISEGTDPNTHKKLSKLCAKKEPKRRRNKTSNNRNKKQTKKSTITTPEPVKLKAHNPKPTRINSLSSFSISRNSSFDWTCKNTASGSSSLEGEKGLFTPSNLVENGKDCVGFLPDTVDHNYDFVHGSDLQCQLHVGVSEGHTLEKLYDEYFQLLGMEDEQIQLDSFAESLFI